jgi:hypothetical protein
MVVLISVTKGFVSRQVNPAWTVMAMKEALTYLRSGRLKENFCGFKVKLTSIPSTTSKSVEKPKTARWAYQAILVCGIKL